MKFFLFLSMLVYGQFFQQEPKPDLDYRIWEEEEILHLEVSSKADSVFFKMLGGLEVALDYSKSEEHFTMDRKIPGLQSANFQYQIMTKSNLGESEFQEITFPNTEMQFYLWTGELSSSIKENEELSGTLLDTLLSSKFLPEPRQLSIYLPENYEKEKSLPVIVVPDGQILEHYSNAVDYLIDNDQIEKLVLLGIHNNPGLTDFDGMMIPIRFLEYVKGGLKPKFYEQHQKFVIEEALPFVGNNFPVKQSGHFLYGFSNGGAFSIETGMSYPEIFSEVIAYSNVGFIDQFKEIKFDKEKYPFFNLACGQYEGEFETNQIFASILEEKEIAHAFDPLVCGHDNYAWKQEFLKYLIQKFGK